jgi:dinuclear metal center YbgI/SA1388 family protein
MKERIARIQDLTGLLHTLYPLHLAESWDNVGLQVGDPAGEVTRVLVCLDPSERALEEAASAGAQALITHHPLIFKPLSTLSPTDETGRILFRAVQQGIAVLCAHTNLDRGRNGLNDWLAQRLGVEEAKPLTAGDDDLLKLVVFVPAGYEGRVAQALFRCGAGHIGEYDSCSFQTPGTGTFRPGSEANPFLGEKGRLERAAEIRLETVISRHRLGRTLERMFKAHPYEEPAYDLIPLANRRTDIGLGRVGRLPHPLPLHDFARRVKEALGTHSLRIVGDEHQPVHKIALCGGSGATLYSEARRQGADVLVTGDIKYHDARRAETEGMALIDAGHFATEHLMVPHLAATLGHAAQERGLPITFIELKGETDPFRTI